MGAKKSKLATFPPPDPMFIPVGCMGLTRKEYDVPRLDLAPFLNYKIRVMTYADLVARILNIFRTLPPVDGSTTPDPSTEDQFARDPRRIYGPVYLFVASDPETGIIEGYLYFPSMTKAAKKWPNYHYLGSCHSWMYRLLFSPDYRIHLPNTNCARRAFDFRKTADTAQQRESVQKLVDELQSSFDKDYKQYAETRQSIELMTKRLEELQRRDGFAVSEEQQKTKEALETSKAEMLTFFEQANATKTLLDQKKQELESLNYITGSNSLMLGCRTESSFKCVQSKKAHKMMRIYKRKKNRESYPGAYFRMYQMNLNDQRLAPFVLDNSIAVPLRNILPSGVDMFTGCRHMLISPNRTYLLVLGNFRLTLYKNLGSENIEDLCRTNKMPTMLLPVKTITFAGVFGTKAVIEDRNFNIYTEFQKDGQEELVFERKIVSDEAVGPYAMVLQDNGELYIYDIRNKVVSTGGMGSETDPALAGLETGFDKDYDPAEDYRQRIIRLIAYLRLVNLYKELASASVIDENLKKDVPAYILDNSIPPYSATEDYVIRLENLVKYLQAKGYTNIVNTAFMRSAAQQEATVGPSEAATKNNMSIGTLPTYKSSMPNFTVTESSAPKVDEYGSIWTPVKSNFVSEDDADADPCEGKEEEELAKCLEDAEKAELDAMDAEDKALETSEDAVVTNDNALSDQINRDAINAMDPDSLKDVWSTFDWKSMFAKPQDPGKSYEEAIMSCDVNATFNPRQDMYCRLIALKQYFRQKGMPVPEQAPLMEQKEQATMVMDQKLVSYDAYQDMTKRLTAARQYFQMPR